MKLGGWNFLSHLAYNLRIAETNVPDWVLVLEAAGHDPLRAMEIEEKLSREWWDRWLWDREQRISVMNNVK